MIIYYDSAVDALEIRLLPEAEVTRSTDLDGRRVIDLDAHGRVVSIEIMGSSQGFEIEDVIERFDLAEHRADLLQLSEGKLPVAQP